MKTKQLRDRIATCAGVLFDLDGTLALGNSESEGYRVLPGALELLAVLRGRKLPFVVFTNGTHHTPLAYTQMLRRVELELDVSEMLTPAVVAADFFARKGYRRVLVLGGTGVSQPLVDAGIDVLRPGDDAETVDATFVGWHPDFALRDIEAACRAGWAGAPLYTASNAPFFATGKGKAIGTSSAICAAIRNATRQRVQVLGKPSRPAIRVAAQRLGTRSERIVVIGDDPILEIEMARAGGSCAIGVLTGLADAEAFDRLAEHRRADLVVHGVDDLISYFTGVAVSA